MGLLAAAIFLTCTAWSTQKPAELELLEASRAGIETAEIEWQVWMKNQPIPRQRFHTRIGGDETACTMLGDDRGVYSLRDGEPIFKPPTSLLMIGEEKWEYEAEAIHAMVFRTPSADLPEIRNVGLLPFPALTRPWRDYLARSRLPRAQPEFCVERTSPGAVVSMRFADAPGEITRWTLDADYAFQPISCELLVDGEVVSRSTVEYQLLEDGTAIPVKAEFRSGKEGQLDCSVDVDHAAVNEAGQPVSLTPEDIGVSNGVAIFYQQGHPRSHQPPRVFCEGEAVTIEQYTWLLRNVGVKPSAPLIRINPELVEQYERVRARAQGAVASQPASQPVLGEWERYTLAFIERYRLDQDQRQRAMAILRECQQRGWGHVGRVKEKLEYLDRRAAEATRLESAGERDQEFKAIAESRASLLKPLDLIFERQLKPRLERLPTRAQRAASSAKTAP